MKKILLIVCALLLSVTVSLAWILMAQEQKTKRLILNYSGIYGNDNLTVINVEDIRLSVFLIGEDGSRTPVDPARPLAVNGMMPGQSLRFALQIQNVGEGRAMKLMLSDILCDCLPGTSNADPDVLLQYMCLCVSGGEKFRDSDDPNYTVPDYVFAPLETLHEPSFQKYTCTVYPSLWIPYTGDGAENYVDLECRFWFDTRVVDAQNLSLSVGHIVMST